jgi:hypothetical protein
MQADLFFFLAASDPVGQKNLSREVIFLIASRSKVVRFTLCSNAPSPRGAP